MSNNIIWVYNGWALLITILAPLYTIAQAEIQLLRFWMGKIFPFFLLASIISLLFLSHWLTAVLYIPIWLLTVGIVGELKRFLGRGQGSI